MTRSLVLQSVALTFLTGASVPAQPLPQTKQTFVTGLIAFMDAVAGAYGDEGIEIRAALEAMESGLVEWDARIWVYETVMTDRLAAAEPRVAADMHTVMGALYLERGRIDEAIDAFDEAAALDPQRADIHVLRGLAHGAAGRPRAAAAAFRGAVERDAGDPVKLYLLAERLLELGESEEATRTLQAIQPFLARRLSEPGPEAAVAPFIQTALVEETPESEPFFPPAAYAEGFALLRERKYEDALARLRAVAAADPLLTDPGPASGGMAQGIAALRAGRLGAAIANLEDAVTRIPYSAEAHRILGTAYWYDEQYPPSVEHLEMAIGVNPADERARIALADVLVEAGRFAEAEQVLQRTLATVADSAQAHYRLGRLYQTLNRFEDALRELEAAAALGPLSGSSRLYASIGQGHRSQMNLEGAADAYRRRVRVAPNDPAAHRELGDIDRSQGRPDGALAELFVALLIDPGDAAAYTAVGQIHLAAGRFDDALPALERAVELDPEQTEARYALATTLIRLGRRDEGQRELAEFQRRQAAAMERERRSYDTNLLRLEAGLRSNDGAFDQAAALWRQVVEREPDVPSNHINLALVLMRAELYQEAIRSFEEALKRDPDADVHDGLAEAYERLGQIDLSRRHRAIGQRMREERVRLRGASR